MASTIINKAAKELSDIIREDIKNKTSPYDTPAEVIRVDGDIVWVHIPGGVSETPVKKTVNASPGDIIQVRVSGGKAWIVGNASAPPTDDTLASRAYEAAAVAKEASVNAREYANVAYDAASDALTAAGEASTAAETASASATQAIADAATAQSSADTAQAAADAAQADATTALQQVTVATQAATNAQTAATAASSSASAAATAASNAQTEAAGAKASAANASEYAARALGNLSTVQSVLETLNWVTEHGTMALTTDIALDPTHVYFILNEEYELSEDTTVDNTKKYYELNGTAYVEVEPVGDEDPSSEGWYELSSHGDYYVGGHYYSVVAEPNSSDIATYYELSIDESLNNYVGTHLALTDEGLWLIPNSDGNKVLIATGGQGHTYEDAGTYIIGTDVSSIEIQQNETHSLNTNWSFDLDYTLPAGTEIKNYITNSSPPLYSFSFTAGTAETHTAISGVYTYDGVKTISFTEDPYATSAVEYVYATYCISNSLDEVLAKFTKKGIQIGLDNESHLEMDYHSLKLVNKEGDPYFYISDLRNKDDNWKSTITETFIGDGTTKEFSVNFQPSDDVSATDSSDSTNSASRHPDLKRYVFDHAPASDATVTIIYKTEASDVRAYTLGKRIGGLGACSFATGDNVTASGTYSHAEGYKTYARGEGSHAEGGPHTNTQGVETRTYAAGKYSHAEGCGSVAYSDYSHAEGLATDVFIYADASHTEGYGTMTFAKYAHAEGKGSSAFGEASHAEGLSTGTNTNAKYAHAEGQLSSAGGIASHAEGGAPYSSHAPVARGDYSHVEGRYTEARGDCSHSEGYGTYAIGEASHAEGGFYIDDQQVEHKTTANGKYSHAEGCGTTAYGGRSHAEGSSTQANGNASHAEGYFTRATGDGAHAEGGFYTEQVGDTVYYTTASGKSSHAEGGGAVASGDYSHAEGYLTRASDSYSHAEGNATIANGGYGSHAEGNVTIASGYGSHAEGNVTIANGGFAHAEGNHTTASGHDSHAEGYNTEARGGNSHAEGYYVTASGRYSHVQGKYNIEDETAYTSAAGTTFDSSVTYYTKSNNIFNKVNSPIEADLATYYIYTPNNAEKAFIIGNGNYNAHSNALTVDWQGRVEAGDYSGTLKSIFDIFYPVGSYYESSLPGTIPSGSQTPTAADIANLGATWFDPNYAWGGTWALEAEGKAHISAGSSYNAGTEYGANSITYTPKGGADGHKLTNQEMSHAHTHALYLPNHVHSIGSHIHGMSHTHAHTHQPNTQTRSFLTATTSGIAIHRNTIKSGTGTSYENVLRVDSASAYNGQTDSDSTGSSISNTGGPAAPSGGNSNTGNPTAAATTKISGSVDNLYGTNNDRTAHSHTFTGTQATLNVMQKSVAVYRWHRTA